MIKMKNIFKLNESEKNRIRGLHGMQLITEEINAECSELFAKLGREILSSRNNEIDMDGKGQSQQQRMSSRNQVKRDMSQLACCFENNEESYVQPVQDLEMIDTSSDAGKGNRIKKGFSGQEENNQAYALLSKQIKEQKIECKK
jgi:hypothetical protein|tara:strand:+ start:884 stop:1315 length:432 start_codon:yes stop_codon:yes gene_type:complete